jgi:uncharacterized membrane protein YgdD (TMEM256/DUF423 family)
MFQLLPHRYKKIGLIIAPLGLFIWVAMQVGWITDFIRFIGFTNQKPINMIFAILGFFSFLLGTYAIAFSKEKIEDEMIKTIRLESFQFSAFLQIVILVVGFIGIGFMERPPKEAGLLLFFIGVILMFWIIYIIRFNYIVHFSAYRHEK